MEAWGASFDERSAVSETLALWERVAKGRVRAARPVKYFGRAKGKVWNYE
jgi:hypothetical protein